MEIIKQLSKIQKQLVAPKGQYNSFGKYNYRSCEDILTAVKPLLPENIALRIEDEIVTIGDRIYVKAIAIFSDGKDTLTSTAYAREPISKKGMDESQITGATSSYARKYALNGLFCIDDIKDADATNKHNESNNSSGYIRGTEISKNHILESKKFRGMKISEVKEDELLNYVNFFEGKDLSGIVAKEIPIIKAYLGIDKF